MGSLWSANWCSRDEVAGIDHIEIVYDNTPEGVSEAHCVIVADNRRIGVTMRGETYKDGLTGFYKCPKSSDLVMFHGGNGAVLNVENVVSWRKLDMYPCISLTVYSEASLVVRAYNVVYIITSVFDVICRRYDVGEIDGITIDDANNVLIVHVLRPDLGGKIVDDIIALINNV